MREILFRGKPKNLKKYKWVQGQLLHHRDNLSVIYSEEADHPVGVIPETVGQFTGLTDKNGKRIFEGDVVIYDNSAYNAYCEPIRGVIAWRNGSLCFKYKPWSSVMYRALCSDDFFAVKCDVIGNIHDNPELLEVQNDQRRSNSDS